MSNAGEIRTATKGAGDTSSNDRRAIVYRMVTDTHICPFGLKTIGLLKRKGFEVEDHPLTTREETDRFKDKWGVATTPQTFLGEVTETNRVGGYDDLRQHFGYPVKDPDQKTYTPVIAVFVMAALMAIAAIWAFNGDILGVRSVEWFVAFSMAILAMLKLRDLDAFSNMFLSYDLLAQRHMRYAYIYPFLEALAAILMIAGGVYGLMAAPIALFIGSVGAWSVIKAVYIDARDLKCACTGGGTNVPLGIVSLNENLAMIAMGLWMIVKATI